MRFKDSKKSEPIVNSQRSCLRAPERLGRCGVSKYLVSPAHEEARGNEGDRLSRNGEFPLEDVPKRDRHGTEVL